MTTQRLRILKAMNEATGHVDFGEFAKNVEMPASEIIAAFHELTGSGHLKKVGGGYGITEKGKIAVRALVPVPLGEEFKFYSEIDKPTGQYAATPSEFYEIIKEIDTSSIEFHTYRKDFEAWARDSLGQLDFVAELADIRESELRGDILRSAIVKAFESTFSLL